MSYSGIHELVCSWKKEVVIRVILIEFWEVYVDHTLTIVLLKDWIGDLA